MKKIGYPYRIELVEDMIAEEASYLLGESIVEVRPLHGGDLSEVVRLQTATGRTYVAKTGPYPEREGDMLRAMIAAGVRAPAPVSSNTNVLVLEDLGSAIPASDRAWQRLGTTLYTLHASTGESYGWTDDYAFGQVRIRNGRGSNWADFWLESRVLVDADHLPGNLVLQLEAAGPAIRSQLPGAPAASLLHGDLWSGNVHFAADDQAWLIDPACYYGHSEVDLAMLTLFGNPPESFWRAYGPLEKGWEKRRHIYQLWPALVHLRLFGEGYRSLVERLLTGLAR